MLTEKKISDKIIKSLEGDEIKWSLKIEQNIVNIKNIIKKINKPIDDLE